MFSRQEEIRQHTLRAQAHAGSVQSQLERTTDRLRHVQDACRHIRETMTDKLMTLCTAVQLSRVFHAWVVYTRDRRVQALHRRHLHDSRSEQDVVQLAMIFEVGVWRALGCTARF